jgi:hypothetical protein
MATMPFELEARMAIGQALLRLPFRLSGAYAMAVRLAPQIVLTESDPIRFLVYEKNSIQGAVFKLALYWSTRYNCFGERAFLPMNPGTLTHQDIAALRECCLQRLPDDNHGQAVYIIKASTIASCSLTSSETRALFYQLHLSSEQAGCIQLLVDATSCNANTSLADLESFFGVFSELVSKALPLRISRVLIISSSPSTTPARSMHSAEFIQLIVQSSLSTTPVVVIKEDSPQEFVGKLESFGLTKAGISSVLGGTTVCSMQPPGALMATNRFSLDLRQHDSYIQNAAHERRRTYDALLSPAEESVRSSSILQEQEEGIASLCPPSASLKRRASSSNQEQGSNNKKIKAYSRAKNNEAAAAALQHPHGREEEEEAFVADNGTEKIKNTESKKEEDEEESIRTNLRQRNALYSRRKYERKKIEVEVMKTEAHRHEMQNVNLLQEQQRLEKLYAKAIKCIKKHEQKKGVIVEGRNEGVVQQQGRPLQQPQQQQQQQAAHASILAAATTTTACGGSPPLRGGYLAAAAPAPKCSATSSRPPIMLTSQVTALGGEVALLRNQEMYTFRECWLGGAVKQQQAYSSSSGGGGGN